MLKDMDKVGASFAFLEKGYVKIAYRFFLAPWRREPRHIVTFTDVLWRQRTNQKHTRHKCSLSKVWLALQQNAKEEEDPQDLKTFNTEILW